jgi:hypothetical protein
VGRAWEPRPPRPLRKQDPARAGLLRKKSRAYCGLVWWAENALCHLGPQLSHFQRRGLHAFRSGQAKVHQPSHGHRHGWGVTAWKCLPGRFNTACHSVQSLFGPAEHTHSRWRQANWLRLTLLEPGIGWVNSIGGGAGGRPRHIPSACLGPLGKAERTSCACYTRRTLLLDGSVQLRARWSAVSTLARALAIAGVPAAFFPINGTFGLAILLVLAVLVLLLLTAPPRRIVTFDKANRVLRIRHRGVLAERGRRDIAFADVESVEVVEAGRKGVFTLHTVHAKVRGAETVYLCTIYDDVETAALKREMTALFAG